MKSYLRKELLAFSNFTLKLLALIVIGSGISINLSAQVAINTDGTAPNSAAMLDVKATGKGILAPRMTLAQRPASPVAGLIIYQTDGIAGFYYYDGATWQKFGSSSSDYWQSNGSDIYFNTGRVGIGLINPDFYGLNVSNYYSGRAAIKGNDESLNIYATGMLGVLEPTAMGIPLSVTNAGVLGIKPAAGGNGAAIYGWNNDVNTDNYAGILFSDGISSNTNYGLFAAAKGGLTNYAGRYKGRVLIEGYKGGEGAADSLYTLFSSQVSNNSYTDTRAIEGISKPRPGYGIALYGEGGYMGTYAYANATTYTGFAYGVYGAATGSSGTRIGIYGYAYGGTANWAGYFSSGSVYMANDLRIGTTQQATGYSVSVNGKIACTEVLVQAPSGWPDYVFSSDYKLMSLPELERSIKAEKHLPGIPSSLEVKNTGVQLGDLQKKLLEKLEELTLHVIDQDKQIKILQDKINALNPAHDKIRSEIKN
ncbi:MAG: hypothetical protein HXX13_06075 [Bacteroidetes bacterium]|nr:hypothetical protein [Bacteroidota bacterium]